MKEMLNKTEQSLENALVEAGIDRKDIQFKTVIGGENSKYIRIGYWKMLDSDIIEELGLEEDWMYDDDCGNLYCYFYRG